MLGPSDGVAVPSENTRKQFRTAEYTAMAAAGLKIFQSDISADLFANYFDPFFDRQFVVGQSVKPQNLHVSAAACSLCEQEPDCP
jgi:hypothetical protein